MTRKQIGLATIGLLLANFMGGLDTTLLNVALSQIVSDMHAVNEVGLLTSILLFTIAVTTVLWGKFAEKIGNKKSICNCHCDFCCSLYNWWISVKYLAIDYSTRIYGNRYWWNGFNSFHYLH